METSTQPPTSGEGEELEGPVGSATPVRRPAPVRVGRLPAVSVLIEQVAGSDRPGKRRLYGRT
jgi:hypothetical protein